MPLRSVTGGATIHYAAWRPLLTDSAADSDRDQELGLSFIRTHLEITRKAVTSQPLDQRVVHTYKANSP